MKKMFYVNFCTDLKTESYKFRYKKDALEKYNELVDRCYFPSDRVFFECVETISMYPNNEEV